MNPIIDKFDSPMGEIKLITLTNANGAMAQLSSLGAGITKLIVPDRDGKLRNVVLGYENPLDYMEDGPCAGKIPGRYANRIARGHFSIDGKEYTLAINNGPNALHGGPTGFQNRIWECRKITPKSVEFCYRSADGEEGYPGNLTAIARYVWNDQNTLELHISATTDAPTVVNLTNHAYFNLDGEDAGSALEHTLWLNADHFLTTDSTLIPTGEFTPVSGTPMDFTAPKTVGRDINQTFPALIYGKGYDNCWVINDWQRGVLKHAATLSSPKSGITLEVSTTQPGVQVYSGNWLKGCPKSVSGHDYDDYDGVAIECQALPDSPNKPQFPSTILRPGEEYTQLIFYKLSILD